MGRLVRAGKIRLVEVNGRGDTNFSVFLAGGLARVWPTDAHGRAGAGQLGGILGPKGLHVRHRDDLLKEASGSLLVPLMGGRSVADFVKLPQGDGVVETPRAKHWL